MSILPPYGCSHTAVFLCAKGVTMMCFPVKQAWKYFTLCAKLSFGIPHRADSGPYTASRYTPRALKISVKVL